MTELNYGIVTNGRCEKCLSLIANPNEITEENGVIYHSFSCEGQN